jgi:hypothetical protein
MDPAQLKASYDQTQFLSDKISNLDRDLLQSQSMQNVEGLKSQYKQTQDILDTQDRAQYANENRQNRNFTLLNDSIKDQGSSVRDTIYKNSGITNDYVNKGASDNLLATERIGSHIDDNIYRTSAGIDQSIYRGVQSVQQGQAEAMRQLQNDIGQVQLESQKSTNELIGYLKSNSDQNWSNFASLSKDVYQTKADVILSTTNQYSQLAKQASDNSATIQIEALKNKADLAKQMAFEYSSLKDKIATTESNLKEVIRSQESDRLRDVLRATEHKSLYFELKDHHHRRHRH